MLCRQPKESFLQALSNTLQHSGALRCMEECKHIRYGVSNKTANEKYQNCLCLLHLPSWKWAETNLFQSSRQTLNPFSHYQFSILFDWILYSKLSRFTSTFFQNVWGVVFWFGFGWVCFFFNPTEWKFRNFTNVKGGWEEAKLTMVLCADFQLSRSDTSQQYSNSRKSPCLHWATFLGRWVK